MSNQNRRPNELEAHLETSQGQDTQLGNFQFLILRDLEELEALKRRSTKNSSRGKCRTVWRCCNKDMDGQPGMTCRKSAGHSATDIKSNPSKIKGEDLSDENCENTPSSQASLSTRNSSDVDASTTIQSSRQPCCKNTSSQAGQIEDEEKSPPSGKEQAGDGAPENQKEDLFFPAECFAQLYKRIEALEDLLQRGLDTFSKDGCDCKETSRNRKSAHQSKPKLPPQENLKPESEMMLPETLNEVFDSNASCAAEASTNEEKQNAEMNELQNIKKRLITLEEKMKRLKMTATQSNLNLRIPSKNNLELTKVEKRSRGTSEKQTESPVQTYSEPESPLQSEILFLNTALNDSADWKINNKVNKKVVTKYKKIRTDYSSENISIKSSQSRNGSTTLLNSPSDYSVPRTRSFESTLYPLTKDQDWDKTKAPAVLYFKCKNASKAWPSSKCLETKPKRVKDLCRKAPVTNFVLSQRSEREINDPHAFGDCKFLGSPRKCGRSTRKSKGYLLSKPSPTGLLTSHRRHNVWSISKRNSRNRPAADEYPHQKVKHRDRERRKEKYEAQGSPKEASEDKIKIPVLFKEVCKPMEKMSNLSMRFLLVQNDPKNPLRNLLEKMSKERSQNRTEQYVLGVNKCSCDEVQLLHPIYPDMIGYFNT